MANQQYHIHRPLMFNIREDPSGANNPNSSAIQSMIETGYDREFKKIFRLSRPVFEALVNDLSEFMKDGRSWNTRQIVTLEVKVSIALYFMAHGGNGITLGHASGLKNNTALKYLHQVSGLIATKLVHKWMGASILALQGTWKPTEQDSMHGSMHDSMV